MNCDDDLKPPAKKKRSSIEPAGTKEQHHEVESSTQSSKAGQVRKVPCAETKNEKIDVRETIAQSDQQASSKSHTLHSKTNSTTRFLSDGKKHVEKNSLVEEELIEAKTRARKKRDKAEITEEDLREERRAANRLSAFQSRQRRKIAIESLQQEVDELKNENTQQKDEITRLRQECQQLRQENGTLRSSLNSLSELVHAARISPATVGATSAGVAPLACASENMLLLRLLAGSTAASQAALSENDSARNPYAGISSIPSNSTDLMPDLASQQARQMQIRLALQPHILQTSLQQQQSLARLLAQNAGLNADQSLSQPQQLATVGGIPTQRREENQTEEDEHKSGWKEG